MKPKHWVTYLTRGIYAFGVLFLITGLLLSVVNIPALAQQSGAVWTTTGSCGEPQNINHYQVGDPVYLNGANFDPATSYPWEIKGNAGGSSGDPNIVVASGAYTTDSAGAFCFFAYTIKPDDWGVYKYGFGNKNDNYSVDGIDPAPALTLDKTAAPATYGAAGATIAYSYVLTNNGNVPLDGPFTVTDNKAAVVCPITPDPLPVGGSITCTASYTILQADMDAGSVTNLATGYASFGGNQVPSNPDSETVNAVQNGALTLDKNVNPGTFALLGSLLSYSYELTNTGNITLTGISVSDDKVSVTCPAAGLTVGASMTCTASHMITHADLTAGFVTNNATAYGEDPNGTEIVSNPDSATATANQSPALALDKTASTDTFAQAGEVIYYSYELTNTGNVPLDGPYTVSDNKTAVTCPVTPNPLPVSASVICTAEYMVSQADVDAGSVTNQATGYAAYIGLQVTSNQDSETVNAVQTPGLTLEKTGLDAFYNLMGQELTYEYKLTNTGNVTLNPPFSVADDVTGSAVCPQPVALAPDDSITCAASYNVTQEDLNDGSITNFASGKGYFGGTEVPTNQDFWVVSAQADGPALGLVKTVTLQTYSAVSEVLEYTYDLTNIGDVTLYAPFNVVDDKTTVTCPGTPTLLQPAESITCTASYTVKQEDLDLGFVTNVAIGQAYDPGETVINSNPDTETATAIQGADLRLVKTVTPPTFALVDDILSYQYELTNSGNVTLVAPFTVVDDKTTVTCPAAPTSLAPNEQIICAAAYTITQLDVDAGEVTNIATAQGYFGQTPVLSNEDTETAVIEVQGPSLVLEKTADPQTYDTVGDVIGYSYELTNNGNVTLAAPFTVVDDKTTVICPAVPTSLAPAEQMTCTAAYAITAADLVVGIVTNTAQAQAYFEDGAVLSNEDSATVTSGLAGPLVTIEAGDAVSCAVDAGEECITFTVTIRGLTAGTVSVAALAPAALSGDEPADFTVDGVYEVTICGDWPGIADPAMGVDLLLGGTAAWYIEETLQEEAGSGDAWVSYDPAMQEFCLPPQVEELLFIDPFCYVFEGAWTMAVQVENPNDEAVAFAWSLNGSAPQAATAAANGIAWLGNLPLGVQHTIAITWGTDGFAEQRAQLNLSDCESPAPPPPPPPGPPPIPVTAVEPAPVVESAELIPVTGMSISELIALGLFRSMMLYLGAGMLGIAFIIESVWKRFK